MKKRIIHSNISIPADDQSAVITQPRECPLDFIATFIPPHLAAVMILLLLVVAAIGTNQLNSLSGQSLSQRIAVIALVGNQPTRIPFGASTARPWHGNPAYRFFEQFAFARGRRVQVVSQRNTLAVDHHHPLRSLAAFGLSDAIAPFLAGAKLPSAKASDQSNWPFSSNSARKVRQALSQTSCSSQSRSRLQQVEGLGYCLGRSAHGAPVRNIQRIPSKTLRLSAHGLPPRLDVLSLGNSGSIFCHCASVSFQRRLVILDSLKKNGFRVKYT
jgi:hypothetical protein